MQKISLKLYLATFVFTLALTSFTFAGIGQCPDDPLPDEEGRLSAPVVMTTNPSEADGYQFIKGFWEILKLKMDLF